MYPSGAWKGFWDQSANGRQEMRGLTLRFVGGTVEGKGRDMVGRFTFRGRYDDQGHVTMVKQYVGRHQVIYEGRYDGEGTIFGQWSIDDMGWGKFALSPVRARPAPDAPIEPL
ncbi:MAG TPA: hypothetical protein VFE78_40240 [Gemmataceae bacterium]|jgi:hypothetical protein|nr:hypothetical protein [Gemmataceae bacterium]